jgi:hypothetical protein
VSSASSFPFPTTLSLDHFTRRAVMLQISHSDPAIFSRRSDAGSSHLRHTNGAIRTPRARPSWRPPSSSFSLPLSRSAPCVCLSTEKGPNSNEKCYADINCQRSDSAVAERLPEPLTTQRLQLGTAGSPPCISVGAAGHSRGRAAYAFLVWYVCFALSRGWRVMARDMVLLNGWVHLAREMLRMHAGGIVSPELCCKLQHLTYQRLGVAGISFSSFFVHLLPYYSSCLLASRITTLIAIYRTRFNFGRRCTLVYISKQVPRTCARACVKSRSRVALGIQRAHHGGNRANRHTRH